MKYCHVLRTLAFRAIALTALVLMFAAPPAGVQAQNARIHHKIVSRHNEAPQMGRDLWFTLLTNYGIDLGGKYFALYVTSPNVTTVFVHITGGPTKAIAVQPYKSAVFNIPLAWEMKSSGVPGDFGIHVWSNDADICAYVMAHNAASSDGMYVIPTIGWGTEYVVAGYASLYELTFEDPSEFGIVANQDNTRVTITPSCDLRLETSFGGCPDCLLASKGASFQVVLNKGQSVQYEAMRAQDCDNYDVTGTVITSNNPIGVEGGSNCPNIPCDYPACDHVLDMIPPVRTWAKTYYSLPFYQPPGAPLSHSNSTFLVISTKPGQVIKRYDSDRQMDAVYFISSKKYDTYWRNDIDQGSRWSSTDPFLVVQYINSATYPDWPTISTQQGDPAEVVINSSDQFTKTVVFLTPSSQGSQSPYTNYVNIVAKSDDKHVTLDDLPVTGLHQVYIDGIYTGYRASNIAPGGHIVKSDSGAGVYIYGYGYFESYAWTGSFATGTFNSADTTPPHADTSGACFQAHVNLSDLLNGGDSVVGLYYIRVDSINNMSISLDPNWVEGKATKTSYYDLVVPDVTKPGIIIISAYDQAGNATTITSTYSPQDARLGPPLQDFGVGNPSNCVIMYDTIFNSLNTPYQFTSIKLVRGNQGFTIDSTLPSSPLAVGSVNKIRICFKAQQGSTVFDTLQVDDGCVIKDVVLTATGGQPDFRITGHDWGTRLLGTDVVWDGTKGAPIEVINTSPNQPLTINSMWVDALDSANFLPVKDSHWATPANPVVIPAMGHDTVTFKFHTALTDPVGPYLIKWYAKSDQLETSGISVKSNTLLGQAVTPGLTFTSDTSVTQECVVAGSPDDSVFLQFVLTSTGSATSMISSIIHGSSPEYSNFTIMRQNGNPVIPTNTKPEFLVQGDKLFVTETFVAPPNKNFVYRDTIRAYYLDGADGKTKLIGDRPLIVVDSVNYHSGSVTPAVANFAPIQYKAASPPSQTFTIQELTGDQSLTILGIAFAAGSPYANAYTLTPQAGVTLPYTIAPNGNMTFKLSFDPSISFDATQPISIAISSNSCPNLPASAVAHTTVDGAYGQGYAASGFSACDAPQRIVTVYNTKPKNATEEVEDTVVGVWFKSTKSMIGTNFSVVGDPVASKDTIDGMGSLPLPILFTPNVGAGGRQIYSDSLIVVLHSARSDDTVAIYVADTAVTEAVTATVTGATNVQIDKMFNMPISFTLTTNGLTEDLSTRKISTAQFRIAFNSNLLDIGDVTGAAINTAFTPNSGWIVNQAASKVILSNKPLVLDTIVLVLDQPAGQYVSNTTQVGTMKFHVMLNDTSDATALTLVSTDLLKADGSVVGNCVTTSNVSGDFTDALVCGNTTLRAVMNGATEIDFIRPATPDPVTGGTVTFSYANRGEGTLTLAVYDVLGNQVALPMDRVHQGAGSWQLACDVSHLPSGQYTYRLSEDRHVISRQFVIQR